NMLKEVLNRWQENNIDGSFQRYTQSYDAGFYDYTSSDASIVNASFIRMKSLSLNYRFPIDIMQALGLEQAQIYLNAKNLFTLTPYKGYDAQSPSGIDLPALTSVYLGIKLTI